VRANGLNTIFSISTLLSLSVGLFCALDCGPGYLPGEISESAQEMPCHQQSPPAHPGQNVPDPVKSSDACPHCSDSIVVVQKSNTPSPDNPGSGVFEPAAASLRPDETSEAGPRAILPIPRSESPPGITTILRI